VSSEGLPDSAELIKPKITEDYQILAALASTGAGFEALGGSSLMLTEPVENSVDSIIEANKKGVRVKGIIRIFIDRRNEQVVIVDNGLGFIEPRHISERPFDSLKKYDPDLTGKFARGLQGFRSYCNTLLFISRRLEVPRNEVFKGKRGNTVQLEFKAERVEVAVGVVDDEFERWSWGDFKHGAIAFYRDWKKGEFSKIRREKLVRRIERHFGELIRKGRMEILIWEGDELTPGKKIPGRDFYECKPRDYSGLQRVNLPPMSYMENGVKKGDVVFELYLTTRGKRDREWLPFLMYKDRPVGDAPIKEIAEFAESPVWDSQYLTGFIRGDFCEINELRLAMKPGVARDFLYQQIEAAEPALEGAIKAYHRGLIDIRRSQEINQLVNKLQSFLKNKRIFDFKIARELGQLSTGEKPERIKVSAGPGSDTSHVILSPPGEPVISGNALQVIPEKNVVQGQEPGIHQPQDQTGGSGEGNTTKLNGGPGEDGAVGRQGKDGYRENVNGLDKTQPTQEAAQPGQAASELNKTVRRRKPRGFNISHQEDEFSDEMSSFDPVNSTVIINTAHERYKKRDDPNAPMSKVVMDYIAELYIWEICKLAAQTNADMDVTDTFLKTKFEFFEAS